MRESATYLKWIAVLCAVMGLFCLGVFAIGYKDFSFGRVMTAVALFVGSGVFGFLSKKKAGR